MSNVKSLVVKMRKSWLGVLFVLNFITIRCDLRKGSFLTDPSLLEVIFVQHLQDVNENETDSEYWTELASKELEEALNVKWNEGTAKNIILFIGDGMGPNTITATRIYKGGESHRLSYEMFPHVGLLKTYSANKMVPDSASTATALLCGVKANQNTVGVNTFVEYSDCAASLKPGANLESLATLALKAGKSAGFVTTMRVTHATPGPIYAHSAARQWECDASMPAGSDCKDIGRQLFEDFPGRDLHVIMGGGRQSLVSNVTATPDDPISAWACSRADGRDLIQHYRNDKQNRNLKYGVVSNNKELQNLNIDETDYLLGIFANSHLQYENDRNKGPEGMPSLPEMVEVAIKVLKKNSKGYFLMVEGGNIDMAHHRGRAKLAINEAATMEQAVQVALELTDKRDTLLVVTSDHTHTMTINGYPDRGSNIFGVVGPSRADGLNYTTIAYGTGGPGSVQYSVESNENGTRIVRRNPSSVDTDSFMYEQIAAVPLEENYHGGGDVIVYSQGPYAHLFHNIHEQHYAFHVMSYAAKIGPYSAGKTLQYNVAILLVGLLSLVLFYD